MTGVMLSTNQSRRLELLLDIAPDVERIFIPYNPGDAAPTSALEQIQQASTTLDLDIVTHEVHNSDEVLGMLKEMPSDIDAIFLLPDSVVNTHQQEILTYAIEHQLPTSGPTSSPC